MPVVIYDTSGATFGPQNGGNSYPLLNSAYPGGWDPNPQPTVTVDLSDVLIDVVNPTSSQLADSAIIVANYSNTESVDGNGVDNVVVNVDAASNLAMSTNSFASRIDLIKSDSQVNSFTVNNLGTISVSQTYWPSVATFNAGLLSAGSPNTSVPPSTSTSSAKYNNSTLNDVAALYSDDNTNEFILNNGSPTNSTATVSATGNYATAYYGRADTTITNYGTIENSSWTSSDTIADGHWAIVAWAGADYGIAANTNPDSDIINPPANGVVTPAGTSALTLTNYGTIKGDIIAMDITPLVYAAAVGSSSDPFPDPSSTDLLPYTVSDENGGPRDSNIENYGAINGNFYLGSGTHVIDNAAGATITGNLDVDQRPFLTVFTETNVASTVDGVTYYVNNVGGTDNNGTPCGSAATTTDPGCATTSKATLPVVGGQSLTLTNEGTWNGNINIFDQPTSVNSITLTGTGFSGNITAVNGTGSNSLTLIGVTNLENVTNFSYLNLTTSQVSVAGSISLVSGATVATTIFGPGGTLTSPSTNLGSINGTLNLQGPTTIVPTFAGIARNGDVYTLASNLTGDTTDITVQNTSALVTISEDPGMLMVDVTSPYQVPGISNAGAATLTNLLNYGGSNAALQALGGAVENLTTFSQVAQAAEQLRPEVNGASIQVPLETITQFQSQIGNRLDTFFYGALPRTDGPYAEYPVVKGPPPAAVPNDGVWMNVVGSDIEQHEVDNVSGYRADTGGFIGGYDRRIVDGFRLGGAVGYAGSTISDNGLTGDHTSLQTFQGIVYGQLTQSNWYVNGSAGFAGLDYDTVRFIDFPGFTDTASGNHGGMLYSGRLDGGYALVSPVGVFIPVASLTYAHIDQDAYTETSMAGAGLSVLEQNTDSLRSGLGLKALFPVVTDPNFGAAVEVHGIWLHEFDNPAEIVTASFVGGSGSFLAIGPTPSRDMADLGAAVRASLPVVGDTFSVSYDAILREQYVEQVGLVHARFDF